ncbi:MAG: CAP domain-containing protein, partial [Bacteroidota bacterium]
CSYKTHGKKVQEFSLQKSYQSINGGVQKERIDTVWHNPYEERLKALCTLERKLKNMVVLPILKPHKGIYAAARNHGKDTYDHERMLNHRGSDGSWPMDRLRQVTKKIQVGAENLIEQDSLQTAREIVIQLLIDAGVKGYRHRLNILNPQWTHIACYYQNSPTDKHQWIQNFAKL